MAKKHDSSRENGKKFENEEKLKEEIKDSENKSKENEFDKADSATGEVAEIKPETEAVEQKNESFEELLQAEKDKYLRLLAEYDNYRKRSVKERENIYSEVRADTALKFLPVYDNLERALENETEDEAYKRGVEMIMTQFLETLKGFGITPIEALNGKFDPELHEAVMHEVDEEKGENEVVFEFKKGFKLGDKVIRFSVVKVAN